MSINIDFPALLNQILNNVMVLVLGLILGAFLMRTWYRRELGVNRIQRSIDIGFVEQSVLKARDTAIKILDDVDEMRSSMDDLRTHLDLTRDIENLQTKDIMDRVIEAIPRREGQDDE